MSDIWLASVDADGIAVVGAPPSGPTVPTVAARLLIANDGTGAGPAFPFNSVHSFAILAGIQQSFYGGGEWNAFFQFLQKPFPSDPLNQWLTIQQPNVIPSPTSWTQITQFDANGNNGAAYFSGGTLSIEKDYGGSQYVFTTPLGAVTVPFNWLDNQPPSFPHSPWVPTDTPLYAVGLEHALGYGDDTVTSSSQVDWFNFYTRQNSVIVAGAALSAADPGVWDMPFSGQWVSPPGLGNYHLTGVLIPSASSQQLTRWVSKFSVLPFSVSGQDYDSTDEQRYVMPGASGFFGLDETTMPEHDIVFGAWQMTPATLMLRRSHDHGHSWTDQVIRSTGLAMSISVQAYAGAVWACYDDGTNIDQQSSHDFGLTWSSPVPVSITGTNPRLVIAPDGTFFYFYFSGTTLVLSRSADLGATLLDASPIPITAGLTAQDFGAVLAADRSLVVSYINSGNWESKRSLDWGSSWYLA